MKNKGYHNVGTVPKSKSQIVETESKSLPLSHIYIPTHFSGLVEAHWSKGGGFKLVFMSQSLHSLPSDAVM